MGCWLTNLSSSLELGQTMCTVYECKLAYSVGERKAYISKQVQHAAQGHVIMFLGKSGRGPTRRGYSYWATEGRCDAAGTDSLSCRAKSMPSWLPTRWDVHVPERVGNRRTGELSTNAFYEMGDRHPVLRVRRMLIVVEQATLRRSKAGLIGH